MIVVEVDRLGESWGTKCSNLRYRAEWERKLYVEDRLCLEILGRRFEGSEDRSVLGRWRRFEVRVSR